MKKLLFSLACSVFLFCSDGCHTSESSAQNEWITVPQDREIANKVFGQFRKERKTTTGELMIKIGTFFLETPYVAHTLEKGKEEKMVINLREMDCTTFIENCLGLARTIRSGKADFERFVKELEYIRYRNGIRNGYPSRLHYFSDWIYDNEQKKVVLNASREIAHTIVPNRVNFMSTHPDSYPILSGNPEITGKIASQESEISERKTWFIPKTRLTELQNQVKDGDIIAFTTHIEGLDVSHVSIAVWKNGRLTFLHASSKLNKVVLAEETLEEYLTGSKMSTGIMVARPL